MEKRRLNGICRLLCISILVMTCLGGCKARTKVDDVLSEIPVHPVQVPVITDDFPPSPHDEQMTPQQQSYTDSSIISRFQYTYSDTLHKPPILIVVDDFGYAIGSLLQGFAELPPEVVFAILPDLQYTQAAVDKATQYGHDIMIHIPMEAVGAAIKPGDRYIKSGMSEDEVYEMISAFHAQMPTAIAANQHMGSTVTADPVIMRYVLRSLDKLGMIFMDSATTTKMVSPTVAQQLGLNSMMRDMFLDVPDSSDTTLVEKLKVLSRFSGRLEPIVIITHCHNRYKLEALQKFITQIKAMGYELISLSDALKRLPTRPPA